jgi:hypothetical protein
VPRNQRIPYAERVLIATEARRGALQRTVAAKHGVSRSSVHRIAKADRAKPSTAPAGQQELPIQRSIHATGDVVSVSFGDGRVLMTTSDDQITLQSIARPHMLAELVPGPEVVLRFANPRAVLALRKRLDSILRKMSDA